LWFALAYAGFLLRDASPDDARRFRASVLLPLRTVLKVVGHFAFNSYNSALYGG